MEQQRGQQRPMMENETPDFHPTIDESYSLAQPNNEIGKGALFVADYLSKLHNRPHDNDDIFWKTFVVNFFAHDAIYRQCISNISVGPPKDMFHCDLCNHGQPDGLEGNILSALFWIKYQSGVLGELWFTDLPFEYLNISGQIILDYENATHETFYENIRVVQAGKLRVVLTPDFKIYSWNFCVRQSEELVPRSFLNTKLIQLEEAAHSSQLDVHTIFPNTPAQVLVDNCKRIVTPVLDIAKIFESPVDKKLGLPLKFVKYLQLVRGNVDKLKNYIKQTGPSHVENLEHFLATSNSAASYQEGSDHAVTQHRYYGSQEALLKQSQAGLAARSCHEESLNQFWNVGNSQSNPALRGKQNNGDHNVVQSHWYGSGFAPAYSSNPALVNQQDWGSSSLSSHGAAFGSKEPFLHTSSQTRSGYEAPDGLNLVQTRWTNPNPIGGFTPSSNNYSLGNQHQALGSRSLLTSYSAAACGGSHIQFQQPFAGKTAVSMWEPQNQSFSNMASEGGTSGVVSNVVVAATSTPADQVLGTIPILAGRQGHSTRGDQVLETIPFLAGREDHRTRADQVLETIPFLAGREDNRTRHDQVLETIPFLARREDRHTRADQVLETIPFLARREDHRTRANQVLETIPILAAREDHRTRADQVLETIPDLAGREEGKNNQSNQLADGNNTDDVELNNIFLEWESHV